MPIKALYVTPERTVTPLELPDLPDPDAVEEEVYDRYFDKFLDAVAERLGTAGEFAKYGRQCEDGSLDVVGMFLRPSARFEGLELNETALHVARTVKRHPMPGYMLNGPIVLVGYDYDRDTFHDLPAHLLRVVEKFTSGG